MKANIWIDKKGDTLRLRWNYEGKRNQLSLGVRDDYAGRLLANAKKIEIEKDIFSGHYDPTLLKYKLRKFGTNASEITAVELFQNYADYRVKDRELSHSSAVRLRAIASKLHHLLGNESAEKVTESVARDTITMMSETLTGRTVKTYLFELRACWEWAKGKYHVADPNPWSNCLDRVKVQPSKRVKPFTVAEIQAIITTFQSHSQYKHYINFVNTAISHALAQGANPIALAEQTGHDKRVMLSTYAHAIGSECLFVDLGAIEIT